MKIRQSVGHMVIGALGLPLLLACPPKQAESTGGVAPQKLPAGLSPAKLQLYVMSKCPYGVQAEDGLIPAAKQLGAFLDLEIDYIVSDNGDGTFKSLHGQPETDGNIQQLCAKKLSPDRYLEFIACQNKSYRDIPGNADGCLAGAGIDAAAFKTCAGGDEGKQLLVASLKRAEAAHAQGSPTILLNGAPYQGGRGTNDFLRAVCKVFPEGKQPAVCASIPKPIEVVAYVISDKRCKDCQVDGYVGRLGQMFPGLDAKRLDWSEDEAKARLKEAELKTLPVILFSAAVQEDKENFPKMQRWFKPAGPYLSLMIQSDFDPTAEICDNGIDDTGNGQVDCTDPTCKDAMPCRPEKKGQLDVFVMSQCPYGVKALDAMKEVLEAFGDEINFRVNYIASVEGDGFRSLHGQPETDEDIRELCAIKHYPKKNKFMDYIWCRNQNIRDTNWQTCTGNNGVAAKTIEACASGAEGKQLLTDNIKLAESLKIGASPTWLANNRYTFSGIAPDAIRKSFCEHNPDLKGCAKTLSTTGGEVKGSCN